MRDRKRNIRNSISVGTPDSLPRISLVDPILSPLASRMTSHAVSPAVRIDRIG